MNPNARQKALAKIVSRRERYLEKLKSPSASAVRQGFERIAIEQPTKKRK